MKKVYICSPCRGDYENNIQRAKEFSRAAVEHGCIPITPHIYLTQFMDDTVPAERELGLSIGRELVLMCDELWAFGLDCPTAGSSWAIPYSTASVPTSSPGRCPTRPGAIWPTSMSWPGGSSPVSTPEAMGWARSTRLRWTT